MVGSASDPRTLLKEKLNLSDEEIERLALLCSDFDQAKDVRPNLLELHARYWLARNGPKHKPMMRLKELFVLTLSQTKYCNRSGRPILVGEWKLHKIITLTLHDLAKLGFVVPSSRIASWRYGKIVKGLKNITSELHEDHWIDFQENPTSYLLLRKGDEKVSELVNKLDWWQDELALLIGFLRYWIVATEKAPRLTQQYIKRIDQEQFVDAEQNPQEIRKKIDSIVRPELERIGSEETLPIEGLDEISLKVDETEVIDLHLKIQRKISAKAVFDAFPTVGNLQRESVQSSDNVFLENGKPTNYTFPSPTEIDPVDICKFVLTIARRYKVKSIIVDKEDFKMIRTFKWNDYRIHVFFYGIEQRIVPADYNARTGLQGKAMIFVSDLSKAEQMITKLKGLGVDMIIVGIFHKSYDIVTRLREYSDVWVKREPYDLGISWRGDIFEPPLTIKDLLPQAKLERVGLARSILPCLEFGDYGAFMSTVGLPTGIWICQNRLLGEHLALHQEINRFAIEEAAKFKPDIVLVQRDSEIGGAIAAQLNIPLAKLVVHKSYDLQIEYMSAIFSKERLQRLIDGKKILFVSLFDSFITKELSQALYTLALKGSDVEILAIFDRWELHANIRKRFKVNYVLSWSEFWLAMQDDTRQVLEKELILREKVTSKAIREMTPVSLLPSCHHYSKSASGDISKTSRDEELTRYC